MVEDPPFVGRSCFVGRSEGEGAAGCFRFGADWDVDGDVGWSKGGETE